MVAVYSPAVLGALTVIPVYFIGKELFGRWVGILSAGLLAILPGEFLGRSILGFADLDAAETLLTTTAMLFLILAVKASKQNGLTFDRLRYRDWKVATKPIIYSLLGGVFLGIFLITWLGALLFVFIIALYFVIQSLTDHLRHKSGDYLGIVGAILFITALVIFAPLTSGMFYLVALVIALLIPPALSGLSWLMARRGIRAAYYPLTVVGLGLAGVGIFYAISPDLLKAMLEQFSIFAPSGTGALTTMEMQGLFTELIPGGGFLYTPAWGNFNMSFFLGAIALLILIYVVIKHGGAGVSLLVVWSLVIIALTLNQRRFALYLTINIALLSGYLCWLLLRLVALLADYFSTRISSSAFKASLVGLVETPEITAPEKARPEKRIKAGFYKNTAMVLAVVVIFFVVFFPNIMPAYPNAMKIVPAQVVARQAQFAPSDAWYQSLLWLKENTPDPFGDPEFYYQRYQRPLPEEDYPYPESAYGVMAWWDYGYWITRIAHRLPTTNPSQAPPPIINTAHFFLSQDEDSAKERIREADARYVIIDYRTTISKFWAIANWAGGDQAEFYDSYYLPQENRLVQTMLFYPEYYRTLVTRLYNFEGEAVTPEETPVISYEEVSHEGKQYKVLTNIQYFPSYEEALSYILSQDSGNHRIVSNNPFISPVPLAALEHYQLVYSSDAVPVSPWADRMPEVKVFEYTAP